MAEEKSPTDQPFSHHIFEDDPDSKRAITAYAKAVLLTTLLITITIWGVLGLYWGADWRYMQGVHNLNGWIVDFDQGLIGATVAQAYLNNTGTKEQISWYTVPASMFPNGESDVAKAVLNHDCWAAVSIHAGATNSLNEAIAARNATNYNNQAVTAYASQARNEVGYAFFLKDQIQRPMEQTIMAFPMIQAQQAGVDIVDNLLTAAPTLLFQPLNYTLDDLRPFDIEVAVANDYIGLIYLLILSFIVVLSSYNARHATGLERRLTLGRLIALRFAVPVIVYFWLSLAYALLSLYFHVPFDRQFGHAGFVVYWMLSWIGMIALGLAMEAVITLITPQYIPYFLVLWIIFNVAPVFFQIEVLPTFFRYGYASIFYNVSETVRTLLFREKNQVGLNFGVLFAWIGVSIVTLPLVQAYVRGKEVREWQGQVRQKKADVETPQSETSSTTQG
ncbi:SNG1 family protein [Phanerochaete sordida]|uniref:SNG1 family protein n=1 Tax=Phanerochaete sordida TaxID=48140 RepID=A0A9P3G578_9APHY|nr:SNG1 family protein [Phanerochaete sordida]